MTVPLTPEIPARIRALVEQFEPADRSTALALDALIRNSDDRGVSVFNDVAIRYRDDHLLLMRAEGRDADREAGRLGLDEVRAHLRQVLPRLVSDGVILLPPEGLASPDARIRFSDSFWSQVAPERAAVADMMLKTGEHSAHFARQSAIAAPPAAVVSAAPVAAPPASTAPATDGRAPAPAPVRAPAPRPEPLAGGSTLRAEGLVKMYRRRRVVNDVALQLQQGEIVGLLGPNGAGKTTTFYMIVGLIQPLAGRILLDGEDVTAMPMYRRARRGIGYLSQEPSIFRKLSVEDNILAILETLKLSPAQREARLERLLDELSIKHLRHSKAYALSGGERRRLEITRALVTEPKFMMLDEPFAGVDPIAVHDIQTIVAGLRHRGIGVLISDHNVEQTLDIVDRAYIMFDGQVKVSGTVRELVFDDTVAEIYLGPTLTARLRARFSAADSAAGGATDQ
ncbi:MAG TPA: LPS export ABC transporter ATP-binding protein [Gemmatimonadaceae bacterium]|nr:LPS export ABC transporter ATP-binding protein [Gemmatimonadaceae bacterium]